MCNSFVKTVVVGVTASASKDHSSRDDESCLSSVTLQDS